ncbi:Xenobiotic-transporting ATPase [Actinobacteria bacterium OK074]|nr:Xenobiotic-transporting ATPase [Actinobacteria bacterium OK074]
MNDRHPGRPTGRGRHNRPPRPADPAHPTDPPAKGALHRAVPHIDLRQLHDSGGKVWRATRGHRGLILTGMGLGLLGAAATLAQPVVINTMLLAIADGTSLKGPIVRSVVLFTADAVLAAVHSYVIGRSGENIVYDIRATLTRRLLRARFGAYSGWKQGDVYSRMVADTSLARISLTQALDQIANSSFMVIGSVALMAWLDPLLLAVTLGCLSVACGLALVLARKVRRMAVRNRRDTSRYGSALLRVLGALPTVKASRAEAREAAEILAIARQARRSGIRASALGAMLGPAVNVGTQLALTVVIALGAVRSASGAMDPAVLTSFILYLFYLVAPLVTLFASIAQFQQGRASLDRIAELGTIATETEPETEPEAEPGAGAKPGAQPGTEAVAEPGAEALAPTSPTPFGLTFDRVTFRYTPDGPAVLDDVSFTVPDRGLTALVGPSGAGKSTVFQLIERLYDPGSGSIGIDGTDIAGLPLDRLRSIVGYVDQDHTLLRGTVRDNLLYAVPDATEPDIAEALRMAHLDAVVAALPAGLDTELGERGAGLSGGQRQRLAIARTLLQAPRFLLLDEATANLDSESEAALRDTIATISGFCAVIAIAHRLSTVTGAQRIVVLDGGRVQAVGTHERLHRTNGLYRRLTELQGIKETVA